MTAPARRNPWVPGAWGDWPPAQARFDAAARDAHRAMRAWLARFDLDDDPVVEVWMDAPGRYESMVFGPGSEVVMIGAVLIPALGRGWGLYWNPETGGGWLCWQRAQFAHEVEALVHQRTKAAIDD